MTNFKRLQEQRSELAKDLLSMSKEELIEHYATEVFEKMELEEYKENHEFYKTELESIINWGIQWLKKNKKDKHHIYIDSEIAKLIYTNTETEFI